MSAPGPGQALFSFVRHWSRRPTAGDASIGEQGRLVAVTEAAAALAGREVPATVNAVADEVGIDQSGASRLIRSAVDAGYLTMARVPADGRRREAAVTPAGYTALERAHEWQERVFDELTAGWSRRRRADFQSAMADLVARSSVIGR
ncbi:MarR family winged helix-turn-helix transcriptional regulator [Nocardiopsis coralliicola]